VPFGGTVLQDVRALVIGGGGGGIGAAITEGLAAAGADVAVVDVDEARAAAAVVTARSHGHRAIAVVADIRSGTDLERAVLDAHDGLGGIDVLVTVVGGLMAFGMPFNRLDTFSDDEWDYVFDVNIRYVYRALKASLKLMVEQGTGGAVVSIGSDAGTADTAHPTWPLTAPQRRGLPTWSSRLPASTARTVSG